MSMWFTAICVLNLINLGVGKTPPINETSREKRMFSLFQVITFPNEDCQGTNGARGTCYTTSECAARGGTTSLTCASGYGVCCIFSLSCGGSTSENNTYLKDTSAPISPCSYTICKSASDICRIRLDFTTFSISGPVTGRTGDDPTNQGGAIGDCTNDQFSVTCPGGVGSPIICGFNTGQHLIVDASDQCHQASFSLGGTPSGTRSWDIKVTQFSCGQDVGGPPGCLQYFTGLSGTVSNFNFPTSSTSVSSQTTHLSNQQYTLCIRRESGYCYICYVPSVVGTTAVIDQTSFGLSNMVEDDMICSEDFLIIPNAFELLPEPDTLSPEPATPPPSGQRICGRTFSFGSDEDNSISICSRSPPFVINFESNDDEANMEEMGVPGGIVGFSLDYQQIKCSQDGK